MKSLAWETFTGVVAPFLVRIDSAIERDTDLEEAGLESLTLVELVAELEARFEVDFPAETLNWETFATVGSLYETTVALLLRDGSGSALARDSK